MAQTFDHSKFAWKDGGFNTLLYYGLDPDHPIEVPLYKEPETERWRAGSIAGHPTGGEKESAFLMMGGENGLLDAAVQYAEANRKR
jgi:hypothetical protein